jgi:hypothetical protein
MHNDAVARSQAPFILIDDGTLDTVIGCARCGEWVVRTDDRDIPQLMSAAAEWHDCPHAFAIGQRVMLGGYQRATIVGYHPANSPIIRSGDRGEMPRERYDMETWSVAWQDSIGTVVTMAYDARALIGNHNGAGIDSWSGAILAFDARASLSDSGV